MSSTQEGSSDPIRGRRNKADKVEKQSRRTWSPKEEVVLLASLKELVAKGWKSDNGFRGGYLQKLEEAMLKEFPCGNIQASPHIHSKITIWKKNYYSLYSILLRSGVGFNLTGNHTIDCEDAQWEQIVNCDVNAKPMRHKSWPMYEEWKEVFGKDRATGDNAEDVMDAVNEMLNESQPVPNKKEAGKEEVEVNEENISVNDMEVNSALHSEKAEVSVDCSGKGKGKKRKANHSTQGMVEIFSEISRGTNARLETICSRIGYEYDLDQAKKDAFMLLEHIPGLSLDEQFDLCEIFADKPDRLTIFKGLPEDKRPPYVSRLLKQNRT